MLSFMFPTGGVSVREGQAIFAPPKSCLAWSAVGPPFKFGEAIGIGFCPAARGAFPIGGGGPRFAAEQNSVLFGPPLTPGEARG